MKNTFLMVVFLLVVAGACYLVVKKSETILSARDGGGAAFQYVAIGDSYTLGEGVPSNESWPSILTDHLNSAGIFSKLVANPAHTGWTTQDVLDSEMPIYDQSKPDFATLQIGVNDWIQGVTPDVFRKNFAQILNDMQSQLPNPKNIIVVTIPDFSVTPTGKAYDPSNKASHGILSFNSIIIDEAGKKGLSVVNVYPLSKDMGADFSLLANDNLHPSGKEYGLWEQLLFPVAEKMLKK